MILVGTHEEAACPPSPWMMGISHDTHVRVVFDADGSRAVVEMNDADGGDAWLAIRNGAGWSLHGLGHWVQ